MSFIKSIALFGVCLIFFTGCFKKEPLKTELREVEIIKISGTLPQIFSSTNLFGNDSVKINKTTLVFTIKELNENEHIRTLEILDGRYISKVALFSRVCEGSRVSIKFIINNKKKEELVNDPKYYIGKIWADDILVKEPCIEN